MLFIFLYFKANKIPKPMPSNPIKKTFEVFFARSLSRSEGPGSGQCAQIKDLNHTKDLDHIPEPCTLTIIAHKAWNI